MSVPDRPGVRIPGRPAVARRARLKFDDTRESFVLLMPERVVMLSDTAAEILELCDGERSVPEIVGELQRRYPQGDVAGDVTEFLEEAVRRQWLEAPSTT